MIKIAEHPNELNFASNGMAEVNVNGKKVCVARVNDQLFACASACPHAGGVGLCEFVQHLSIFDYVCVSADLTDRVLDDPQHPYTQLLVSSVLTP